MSRQVGRPAQEGSGAGYGIAAAGYPPAEADRGVRAILIRGAGGRAFCAGGDVRAIREAQSTGDATAFGSAFFRDEYRLNRHIARLSKPWIALLDGIRGAPSFRGAVIDRAQMVPLGLALLVSASFFGYFSLITGSPFALIEQMHVSSTQFAFAFAINASSFIVASFLIGRLARSVDPEILLACGTGLTLLAAILTWTVDTHWPSIAGFVATWTVYAFGIAFALPGSFATVLSSARRDAGLAAGLLGAAQMLFGALGSALSGALPGVPTTTLGLLALIGGIGAAAGYLLSRPPLGEQRQLSEARTDDT